MTTSEFNDWYQHVHLGQMATFRGFQIRTMVFPRTQFMRARNPSQLTIFEIEIEIEIETDEIDAVMAELEIKSDSGELTMSEDFSREFVYVAVYDECGVVVGG